jgi:hypothetical protein
MFTNFSNLRKASWFYILAFGLSLVVAFLSPLLGGLTPPAIMFTPLIGVLLMFFVVTRDGYSKAGWLSLGLFRPGVRNWGLAILAPVLVMLCTYGIAWGIGIGRLDQTALAGVIALDGPGNILSTLFRVLLGLSLSTILALAEEIGWRLFLLSTTVGGVFFGYLRLTSASVWSAALGHGAFNMSWSTFTSITVAIASPVVLEYWAGESGVLTLIEVALVAGWLLYRLREQPAATLIEPTLA